MVLFCNKATHKQVLLVLEQTCKRFPSINFLKVCSFKMFNLGFKRFQSMGMVSEKLKDSFACSGGG